jgi:multidrug transporter EmrE-like cation transporter
MLFAVVALSATAHVLLKIGMNQIGEVGSEQLKEPVKLLQNLLTTPVIVVAVPVYALSFAGWILVLSRLRLSLAYPALAVTYVIIPLAGWALLSEPVSRAHWVGVFLIALGLALTVRGAAP